MRTEHPGIEGGLCGFCPAFLNREHQTGDASAVLVEEGESQSSLPSVSSPSSVANGDNVATFIVTCGNVTEVPTPVSPLWGRCCERRSTRCSGACSISSSAHVAGAQEEG